MIVLQAASKLENVGAAELPACSVVQLGAGPGHQENMRYGKSTALANQELASKASAAGVTLSPTQLFNLVQSNLEGADLSAAHLITTLERCVQAKKAYVRKFWSMGTGWSPADQILSLQVRQQEAERARRGGTAGQATLEVSDCKQRGGGMCG